MIREGIALETREKLPVWKALIAIQKIGLIITGIGVTGIVAGACILRFFNINFAGFEEILVMVAFWLYMLGCAYGSYEKSHINANLIEVMMKEGRLKDFFAVVRTTLTTVLCAIMLYWAFSFFTLSIEMETKTPVFRIPMAIGYVSMVVGLALSTIYNICYNYDAIAKLIRGKEAIS
jgi:TRAP-type C4-dicarboxylate transport system permease small subunit